MNDNEVYQDPYDCSHLWISNSGQGGKPQFVTAPMGGNNKAIHVKCEKCNARTWFNEAQWNSIPNK